MTEHPSDDSLAGWLGEADASGIEAEQALARLRRSMFSRAETNPTIGRYRDVQPLGRGGLGVVYRAWDERLDRAVAIKLLRAERGLDRTRLTREAQALAQLDHPNVVEVFDIGDHRGEAFVAMELVEGHDLAGWLAERPRTSAQILDAFVAAGRGLAAAHSRGITHRDFKPSNVLIGDDGRVRVADFGLASSGHDGSTTAPSTTLDRSGSQTAAAGTPRYMAPEQRAAASVGPRADQWSFAASLWESLSTRGSKPEHPCDEPLPSTVPAAVGRVLRRALQTDPRRRFPSMDALLLVLDRARRPRGEQPLAMLAAAGTVVVLIAAASDQPAAALPCRSAHLSEPVWNADRRASLYDAFRSTGSDFADRSARTTELRVDDWLSGWTDAHETRCHAGDDRALLCLRGQLGQLDTVLGQFEQADVNLMVRAGGTIERLPEPDQCAQFSENEAIQQIDPLTLARHIEDLAEVRGHAMTGHYDRAAALASALVERTAQAEGPSPLLAEAQTELGANRMREGKLEEAASLLEEAFFWAVEAEDALLATKTALTRLDLAVRQSDHDTADAWARHVRTWIDRQRAPKPLAEIRFRLLRIESHIARGHYDAADRDLDEAWAQCDRNVEHVAATNVLTQRGLLEIERANYDAAAHAFEHAMVAQGHLYGPEHPELASLLTNLGNVHWYRRDLDAAQASYEHALELRLGALGEQNPKTVVLVMNLGLVDLERGEPHRAVVALERAADLYRATLGDEHPETAAALSNLASAFVQTGDLRRSERLHRRALATYRAAFGPEHPRVAHEQDSLAATLVEQGRIEEALPEHEEALKIFLGLHKDAHPAVAHVRHNLAVAHRKLGQWDLARRYDDQALRDYETVFGREHAALAPVLVSMGRDALRDERWDDAAEQLRRALALDLTDAHLVGRGTFYLAQAEHRLDPESVPNRLEQAERALLDAGPPAADTLATLRQWSADNGVPLSTSQTRSPARVAPPPAQPHRLR